MDSSIPKPEGNPWLKSTADWIRRNKKNNYRWDW